MSGILGIGGGNSVFGLALQGALAAATGGTSLAVTTALRGVMMAVGDQVLQQIGQKLGLPQPAIDLAQATFHSAAGDPGGAVQNIREASQGLGSVAGMDDHQTGQIEQQANDGANWVQEQFEKGLRNGSDEEGNARGAASLKGAAGKSFLVRLALALGKVIDAKQDEMIKKAEEIDKASGSDKSQTSTLSAEMNALSQEVNFISTALSTSIKSVGEATATLARKN